MSYRNKSKASNKIIKLAVLALLLVMILLTVNQIEKVQFWLSQAKIFATGGWSPTPVPQNACKYCSPYGTCKDLPGASARGCNSSLDPCRTDADCPKTYSPQECGKCQPAKSITNPELGVGCGEGLECLPDTPSSANGVCVRKDNVSSSITKCRLKVPGECQDCQALGLTYYACMPGKGLVCRGIKDKGTVSTIGICLKENGSSQCSIPCRKCIEKRITSLKFFKRTIYVCQPLDWFATQYQQKSCNESASQCRVDTDCNADNSTVVYY